MITGNPTIDSWNFPPQPPTSEADYQLPLRIGEIHSGGVVQWQHADNRGDEKPTTAFNLYGEDVPESRRSIL